MVGCGTFFQRSDPRRCKEDESGDGADLARQVGRLLDDADLAARRGDAARRDAIERFSEARLAVMIRKLCVELLEERGR